MGKFQEIVFFQFQQLQIWLINFIKNLKLWHTRYKVIKHKSVSEQVMTLISYLKINHDHSSQQYSCVSVSIISTDCFQNCILFNGNSIMMQQKKLFSTANISVRGLTNHTKQEEFYDIDKYKIDTCCLQETKISEHLNKTTTHGNRLIAIPSNSQYYSNDFIIKNWKIQYMHIGRFLTDMCTATKNQQIEK